MSLDHDFSDAWMVCPNTGYQKLGESVTIHSIPGGWALWWRCSTCHRWHMIENLRLQKKDPLGMNREDLPKLYRDR
jgi:hypothetical protein